MNCPRQYCVAAQIGKISQKMQSIAMLLKLFMFIYSWDGVNYGEVKNYIYFMIKTQSNIGECNYVMVWSCMQ